MKIEALVTFLDGRDRFEKGDVRTVDDERGFRLVGNGWAANLSGEVEPPKPEMTPEQLADAKAKLSAALVTLDIKDATHAASSDVIGG